MPPGSPPPPQLARPSLRLAELQKIAYCCGLNSSGTKPTIAAHINSSLQSWKPAVPDSRILSIDLGVRNLAYSLLSPPAAQSPSRNAGAEVTDAPRRPRLLTWQRLALFPRHDAAAVDDADDGASSKLAVDFSPAAISEAAVRLVQERLLPLRPSHVLIERQRFRSGGGTAVLEWTVRVNSLEAMMYAILAHLRATGAWDGVVIPIEPRKVAPFVLEGITGPTGRSEADGLKAVRRKASDVKKLKVDLLGGLLRARELELIGDDTNDMVDAYLHRISTKSTRKMSTKINSQLQASEKLDDLADSLLQGLAWIKWQENRGLVCQLGDLAQLRPFMH